MTEGLRLLKRKNWRRGGSGLLQERRRLAKEGKSKTEEKKEEPKDETAGKQ